MQEIKFREWNKDPYGDLTLPFMDDWDTIKYAFPDVLEDEGIILMQYTGLKDKNGKEIYEGDIIRIKNGNKPITAYVSYTLTYMGWTLGNPRNLLETAKYDNGKYVKKSALHEYVEWGHSNSPRLEVIGNIYENPELSE